MLLVGGLSAGTFHTHKVLEWNHAETHHNLDHSLTEFAPFCPICGYLVKSNYSPSVSSDTYLTPLEILPAESYLSAPSLYLTQLRGRSPPISKI